MRAKSRHSLKGILPPGRLGARGIWDSLMDALTIHNARQSPVRFGISVRIPRRPHIRLAKPNRALPFLDVPNTDFRIGLGA